MRHLVVGLLTLLAGVGVIIGANTMGSTRFTGPNTTGIVIGLVLSVVGGVLIVTALFQKARDADRSAELRDEVLRRHLDKEPPSDEEISRS